MAGIATPPKRADLREIAKPVGRIDEDTMRVTHVRDCERRIGHAGYMREPCALGEHLRLAREVVVEGVVHEMEHLSAADVVDRLDGLTLRAQ